MSEELFLDDDGLEGMDELDNFEMGGMGETETPKNSREAIGQGLKNGTRAFAEEFTDNKTETIKDIVKNALPNEISPEVNDIIDIKDSFLKETETVGKEIKSQSKRMLGMIDTMLPKDSAISNLVNKANNFLGSEDSGREEVDKNEQLRLQIQNDIATSLGERQRTEDLIKEAKDHKMNMSSLNLTRDIAISNDVTAKFNTGVANLYYRKSLELKIRSNLMQKESLEFSKKASDTTSNLLDMIVRNTALPDILKTRSLEAMKAIGRDRFLNNTLNTLFTDNKRFQGFKENLINKTKSVGEGVLEGMTNAEDTLDMASGMMGEDSMMGSRSGMVGSMAASSAKERIGKGISKMLMKNEKIASLVFKGKEAMLDPESFFQEKAENSNGILSNVFSQVADLSNNRSARKSATVSGNKDLLNPAIFDNRTRESILSIPQLLTNIQTEVYKLRTGEDVEEMRYDLNSGSVQTTTDITTKFKTDVKKNLAKSGASTSFKYMMTPFNSLSVNVSKDEANTIANKLALYAASGKPLAPGKMIKNGFIDYFPSGTRERYSEIFNAFLNEGTPQERFNRVSELIDSLTSLKNNLPNPENLMQDMMDDGNIDLLVNEGIVDYDKDTDTYSVNETKYDNLMFKSLEDSVNEEGYLDKFLPKEEDRGPSEAAIATAKATMESKKKMKSVLKNTKKGFRDFKTNNIDNTEAGKKFNKKYDDAVDKFKVLRGKSKEDFKGMIDDFDIDKALEEGRLIFDPITNTIVENEHFKTMKKGFGDKINDIKASKEASFVQKLAEEQMENFKGTEAFNTLNNKKEEASSFFGGLKKKFLKSKLATKAGDLAKEALTEENFKNALKNGVDGISNVKDFTSDEEYRNFKIKEAKDLANKKKQELKDKANDFDKEAFLNNMKNKSENLYNDVKDLDEAKLKEIYSKNKKKVTNSEAYQESEKFVKKNYKNAKSKIDDSPAMQRVIDTTKTLIDKVDDLGEDLVIANINKIEDEKVRNGLLDDLAKKKSSKAKGLKDSLKSMWDKKLNEKIDEVDKRKEEKESTLNTKEFAFNDRDGSGTRDGGWKERLATFNKQKDKGDELAGRKPSIKESTKNKDTKGLLGMIAGSIAGISPILTGGFSMMSGVLSGVFKTLGLLSKGVLTVLPMILTGILKLGKSMFGGKNKTKAGGKAVAKSGMKATTKAGAKVGAKALGKGLLKKLPGIGLLAGLGFGADRLFNDGDILGALGEVGSGALSLIPGLGTAGSVAMDAWLAKRDYDKATSDDDDEDEIDPLQEHLDAEKAKKSPMETMSFFKKFTKAGMTKDEGGEGEDGGVTEKAKIPIIDANKRMTYKDIKRLVLDTKVPVTIGDKGVLGKHILVKRDSMFLGLNPTLKSLLLRMAKEYYDKTGKSITLNSGFRSTSEQRRLRARYGNKAARPGYSTHEFGLAVDINTDVLNELDSMGLMQKYGLTRPIGKETWHVEPAGIQANVHKAKHNDEFASQLILGSLGKGGDGWGLESQARKYSRSKNHQMQLMKAKANSYKDVAFESEDSVIANSTAKTDIIAGAKEAVKNTDKKVVNAKIDNLDKVKEKSKVALANQKAKTVETPSEFEMKPKDKESTVKASKANSNSIISAKSVEHLSKISNTLVASLNIQQQTLEINKESLELQKQTIEGLKEIKVTEPKVEKNKQTTKEAIPDPVVSLKRKIS